MTHPRTILHADMDAFYASIEQRDDPSLRGKPVMVGGTSNRGVVSAASYEARRFGVHSAMPTVEARRLCPHGVFLRGDMRRYRAESTRIFALFRRFTPRVEGLSLDEAFLDLTGTTRLLGPARKVGEQLRACVREETGLAISVGIAPIKMAAKLASDLCKPDGLLEIPESGLRDFLDPLPVGRLWGVGAVGRSRLEKAGFHTVGDLARADPVALEQALGAWGASLARLARGQDSRDVESYRDPVSCSEENTFATDVSDPVTLESAIRTHAEAVARRLRNSGLRARTVVLKLKLSRRVSEGPRGYPLLTRRTTLADPSDDGEVFARTARQLLRKAALAEPVRLLGVGTTNLERSSEAQLDLFGGQRSAPRRDRLNRALDEISERFGNHAVKRGSDGAAERAGLSLQIKRGEEPEPSSASGRPASEER